MYRDALFQRIPDGSEVHLIPKIAGGRLLVDFDQQFPLVFAFVEHLDCAGRNPCRQNVLADLDFAFVDPFGKLLDGHIVSVLVIEINSPDMRARFTSNGVHSRSLGGGSSRLQRLCRR